MRIPLKFYTWLDNLYLYYDRQMIKRTRNLDLMPGITGRLGIRPSYGEWCHIIGIFQTLLGLHLDKKTGNHILDVGCGTGILAIASEPFVGDGGSYTGIDVRSEVVEFCRRRYPQDKFSFQHLEVSNAAYAPGQPPEKKAWEVNDHSIDLVVGLSVWTHMNEDDAMFYFRQIDRVLKVGGKAILTFYLLDQTYYDSLPGRSARPGRYHKDRQDRYVFDTPSCPSANWLHPAWAKSPEETVSVTSAGVASMVEATTLRLTKTYAGNWKEVPGVFFQDVLVFEKS